MRISDWSSDVCSSDLIWVTESSTTLADAPGYVARISTEGGATVGYIETGRVKIDSAPASMMMIAMTHAKMGRSMKKRAMGVSVTPARPARAWWWCLRWQPSSLRRRHARRHQIGRAHVCTPVTNAHLVGRLLL